MVVAFPTFDELLRKVKQPDLPDLKPPQTEFDTEGASQFGYKLPSGWKLNRQDGHGDTLLSPRGFKIRDFKTGPDGRITDFKMFDANDNPVDIPQPDFVAEEQAGLTALAGTPKTLPGQNTIMKPPPPPQLPPTEPPVNPIERDIEGPGIDIGLQPNEELFFDPQEGRMVRRIKPPPPLSPFQKVAQAAQASQDVVKGLGQLGLQAAKGAQDVFAPARALLTGRYPTREEQEQAGRVLAASGQTGQDIAKSLVTFKPGETGLPPEVEAGMLLPGTGLTMGVGRAARLAATTARNVVPGAVARGLEVTKPILAEERGGIRLPRKLTSVWEDVTVRDKNWMKGQAKEEAAFAAQEAKKAAKGVGAGKGVGPVAKAAKGIQVRIIPSAYRGEQGFNVTEVGAKEGFPQKVWVKTRVEAEQAKSNMIAGREPFEGVAPPPVAKAAPAVPGIENASPDMQEAFARYGMKPGDEISFTIPKGGEDVAVKGILQPSGMVTTKQGKDLAEPNWLRLRPEGFPVKIVRPAAEVVGSPPSSQFAAGQKYQIPATGEDIELVKFTGATPDSEKFGRGFKADLSGYWTVRNIKAGEEFPVTSNGLRQALKEAVVPPAVPRPATMASEKVMPPGVQHWLNMDNTLPVAESLDKIDNAGLLELVEGHSRPGGIQPFLVKVKNPETGKSNFLVRPSDLKAFAEKHGKLAVANASPPVREGVDEAVSAALREAKPLPGQAPLEAAPAVPRPVEAVAPGAESAMAKGMNKIRAYHITDKEFNGFNTRQEGRFGSHFGSEETIKNVAKSTGKNAESLRSLPVELDIKNPIRMPDLEYWEPKDIAQYLETKGITVKPRSHLGSKYWTHEDIIKELQGKGYDGVVYNNKIEGGGDSFIAFEPEQISILPAETAAARGGVEKWEPIVVPHPSEGGYAVKVGKNSWISGGGGPFGGGDIGSFSTKEKAWAEAKRLGYIKEIPPPKVTPTTKAITKVEIPSIPAEAVVPAAKQPWEMTYKENRIPEGNTIEATFNPRNNVEVRIRTRRRYGKDVPENTPEFTPEEFDIKQESALANETINEVDNALESSEMRRAIKSAFHVDWTTGKPKDKAYVGIILTDEAKDVGMGSAGKGSAKVFWSPYSNRALYEKGKSQYGSLGVDPIATLAHEYHHALGGAGELDIFSDAIAARIHLRHNLEIIDPNYIKEWIWSQTNQILRHPKSKMGLESREAMGFARQGNPELFDKLLESNGVWGTDAIKKVKDQIAITTRKWKSVEPKPNLAARAAPAVPRPIAEVAPGAESAAVKGAIEPAVPAGQAMAPQAVAPITEAVPPLAAEVALTPTEVAYFTRSKVLSRIWEEELVKMRGRKLSPEALSEKVAQGEAATQAAPLPGAGGTPPVKQATLKMKATQKKGLDAPETVTPQEAKQAHIDLGSPDGPQPPKRPAKGRKTPPPDEPANILRQIAEKATSGERADQTLLRLHEGAITAETGRVGVIVRDGNAKLRVAGIGVYRRGHLVPRSNDIPQLDELYKALHNPSKVASGELQIPKGYEAIYKELRELTDWESVARLDFDPNMATIQDYFYRGWKPPEGLFANVAQGRPIVKTPAFKKPRVDATYQEMRDAGFEPLFWNPYQQWGLSRMQGVKYREQMELVSKLKGMGDELIRPHAGGPIPQGWRVPEVGPAFEGKPFATTNPTTGEPMTMFTRRWIMPDAVANMMENIYGKPPSIGKLIVGGKAFDPLAVIDWLTFIPKRAKLFGSFFQQIDFLNRNGAGAWSMLVDSLQAGKPVQGVMALARYPVNAVNILRANFSPAYRQSLARQLNSTTPLIKGRPGVNLKGISEAGLSTIDPTMLQWKQMDKVVQAVARETGVFKRLSSLVGDIESSMRRGLFSGVYPAAMITDIKRYTAPMVARMYPKLNDAQLNGQIARIINKKYSTIPASQSVIQNQVLRETLRRVFFSMGETEGLLRQATGAIRGPEAAYWRKHYIGTYLFLIATASAIHFASTGKPLPKERFVPVSKDNWGPLPFSYNTKFASPTIPLKGREGAEVTLDVVGQMDTALRILDPGSFITARESTPIRALVNQISGTNFGGVSIDDVGPGGVLSRTAQLAQDLFAPIGAGPLAAEVIRENIPGAKELVAPQEARLGRTGLGVQATGINVRAANINDFIVDMAKIKGLPEREGQTPWDGTFEGLNPKEVAKLRRLPEAKAYAEALGETPANIERRVDERDFKAQEERSSWLGEWTGTGWSNGQRPDPANPGKMLPYTINQWKDDLSKQYTKKATEAATRERIQGEFKRRKPKDEKEKALWDYYKIADKYTEKDKDGKPIPGGKIQDMEGFMQEQDEYLAGLSPELEKHVIDNLGVGDDPKATQFRNDKREIRKSYWKPLKDIEDPRSEDKLNEAQTLRIKGKIKEAESIEKVHHLAGYTMFKNDREDLLRRQNPQLDELLVKWGYGGSFKNPLNIDRQLGLDYPDKQELTKLYSAYYALPSTSYLALSQAQVDAGRLPEKYKAEWELYRKLKTDTAKGLFRKAHKEASNSDLQEEFRRSHPDFDEWLQQAKGLNPLKAEKAKKAPRIRSSVSLGSAGMRGFGGGVSKTSARKYPRFKKARVSRAMTIRAPR